MIKGLKELERDIEKFKERASRSMASSVERDLERKVEPEMKRKIVEHDAVASTELYRSFTIQTTRMEKGDYAVHLTNYAPHSELVEFGTGGFHRPNRYTKRFAAPPLSPHLVAEIKKWAIIKPTFSPRGSYDSAAQDIAHAIAFGSKKRNRPPGTPAQPFFFNTWFEKERRFKRSMDRSFKNQVKIRFGL